MKTVSAMIFADVAYAFRVGDGACTARTMAADHAQSRGYQGCNGLDWSRSGGRLERWTLPPTWRTTNII